MSLSWFDGEDSYGMVDCRCFRWCRLNADIRVSNIARENRQLKDYVLLILLDEGIHKVQRQSLIEFVHRNDAKNAMELGWNVRQAAQSLALKYSDNALGINGLLWGLKKP